MTTGDPDNRVTINVDLPKGAVLTDSVLVMGYIDSDGDPGWLTRTGGSETASNVIGLLEMAKHRVIHKATCEEGA